jgi:hypothetical protein
MKKDLTLLASAARTSASYTGDWVDVSYYTEALLALSVTAQGTYGNETLDVIIQGKDALGNVFTLASFTQVGNVTAAVPYIEPLKLSNFGGQIRAKATLAGTTKNYTFSVSGMAKREGD